MEYGLSAQKFVKGSSDMLQAFISGLTAWES